MHNPPHPGEVLKDAVLSAGVTITAFARRLSVSRVMLSNVVNGHVAISADMVLRLAGALGTSPESWLRMQEAHDLWQAQKKRRPKIEPLKLVA
jgi:addiction module HigA family antidote